MTRPVKVLRYAGWNAETRKYNIVFRCMGTFHQFSMDYEDFEHGVGNFATAIIEFEDGTVENIPVKLIQFADKEAI